MCCIKICSVNCKKHLYIIYVGVITVGYEQEEYEVTESDGVAEVCAVIYSQTDGGATRPFQLSVSTENSTTGYSNTPFPFPTLFIILYVSVHGICYSYTMAASGLRIIHEWLRFYRARGRSPSGLSQRKP